MSPNNQVDVEFIAEQDNGLAVEIEWNASGRHRPIGTGRLQAVRGSLKKQQLRLQEKAYKIVKNCLRNIPS